MRVNILNLAAYDVTHIEEAEHDYHITADTIMQITKLPRVRLTFGVTA